MLTWLALDFVNALFVDKSNVVVCRPMHGIFDGSPKKSRIGVTKCYVAALCSNADEDDLKITDSQ